MMRRGQAFETMMLVISVIVALAILAVLMNIIGGIGGIGQGAPDKLMHDAGCGCDIWQGLILGLDEYDETRTGEIDTGRNDRFALADGTVIVYMAERDTWDVQ